MASQDQPAKDVSLTVNEQVIVMSGHETIRVLEVEVDTPQSSTLPDGKGEPKSEDGPTEQSDSCTPLDQSTGAVVLGEQPTPAPPVQTLTPSVPISVSLPQAQATVPITVQGCPQVLTQESLATLMTGMAQAGTLGQPLLIPLNMAGSLGGQGSLAVLTLPTTNVATLPGLAAATTAGNLLKLPFAGLQAAAVLNSVQPQLQTGTQAVFPSPAAQPVQSQAPPTPVSTAAAPMPPASSAVSQSIPVAALQTAGLSINPAIINAATLGAQTQFLGSIASTPIFTNAMSNMAGITSQIITNAQGQVIGTLPLLLNPSLTGATPTLPLQGLQGLQVQTVSPQILFNNQGQIIAAVGNGPATVASSASVQPKTTAASLLSKSNAQASITAVSQSPVVIAPSPSVLKSAPTLSSTGPITCADVAKVGQLVNKPQPAVSGEEGINLEEIREFAKNFKIRRLSLGLTQTQVGQALTATEGPAYSQSAICRFEKLDITPKSAQKLKPVLEKWLAEAEHWNQKGQQNLMEFVGGEPSKKRKRRTSFTPQAIEVLNSYFEKNALPTGQEITEIARELNYDREVVRVWFCNRRQTLKNTSKINVFQAQQ
ncbi:POU domain, class 6, transcription factor 1 [Boleophthalmus pectinirostris]|uniref:POU domain, class 6, transcription factor 1 n=1 Tax=Boleophthalmus pectinirostris TaxID=150288 RepID=UPI00242E5298|nr:POU domain, class 6, transcription factor 1 [Boleophthalmus pectinirostris]